MGGAGAKVIKSISSKGGTELGTVPVGKYASGDLGLEAGPDQGIATVGGEESVHGLAGSAVSTASFHSSVDVSLPELPRSDPLWAEYLLVDDREMGPVVVGTVGVEGIAVPSNADWGIGVLSSVCEGERVDVFGIVGAGVGVG